MEALAAAAVQEHVISMNGQLGSMLRTIEDCCGSDQPDAALVDFDLVGFRASNRVHPGTLADPP